MRQPGRLIAGKACLRAVLVGLFVASALFFTDTPAKAQGEIPSLFGLACWPPERRAPGEMCCPPRHRWDARLESCIQPGPWCYRLTRYFSVEIYPCCPGGNWPVLEDGVWRCPPTITVRPPTATLPPQPCPTGSFRNESGKCITITVKPRPIPRGSIGTEPPLPCPKGTVRDATGQCVKTE